MGRTSTQTAGGSPGRPLRQSPAAPALLPLIGLVRSVTTPEFAGVTFHEVTAKSVLNKVVAGSRMPFEWTINPYRGWTHACVYCSPGRATPTSTSTPGWTLTARWW